jgi:hypothetical protein
MAATTKELFATIRFMEKDNIIITINRLTADTGSTMKRAARVCWRCRMERSTKVNS